MVDSTRSLSQMKPAGFAQSKNHMPAWLPPALLASGGSVWCSTRPHTLVSLSGTYCNKSRKQQQQTAAAATALACSGSSNGSSNSMHRTCSHQLSAAAHTPLLLVVARPHRRHSQATTSLNFATPPGCSRSHHEQTTQKAVPPAAAAARHPQPGHPTSAASSLVVARWREAHVLAAAAGYLAVTQLLAVLLSRWYSVLLGCAVCCYHVRPPTQTCDGRMCSNVVV